MDNSKKIRIDKFLWAVRLFKTRSTAGDACRNGKILINDYPVKSSRIVSIGEIFVVKKNPVIFTFIIKNLLENRIGPKLVDDFIENLTSLEELQKMDSNSKVIFVKRDRGTGRPTKKERREIDKLDY